MFETRSVDQLILTDKSVVADCSFNDMRLAFNDWVKTDLTKKRL
jgi:hypothetical protein